MPRSLAQADWTQREDLARLVTALGAGNLRWVGGAVRDTLLGVEVADVDAATPLLPDEVTARLEATGVRVIPTGIDHGTVTAVLPGGNVEITTLRKDVASDGRRATIAFAQDWREDAARRDFTINALYADPATLAISDYFGGLSDLAARRVRFIGSAPARIAEDHLRILRYYRFQARFGSALDDEAEAACADLAPTLKGLSRERVAGELLALLGLSDPHKTVERMFAQGVLPVVLPECGAEEVQHLAGLIAHEKAEGAAPDALRRLAALLPADPRRAEQVAARLRLSTKAKKKLVLAASRQPEDHANPRALAYRLGRAEALDRLLIAGASIASLSGWDIPELPLKGGEIVARGISAGPRVAQILQAVEAKWIEQGFPGREKVLNLLQSEIEG